MTASAFDTDHDLGLVGPALTPEASFRAMRALQMRRAATTNVAFPRHWPLDSPGLGGLLQMARQLARAPGAPILIEGERGAGTFELARFVHEADPLARSMRLRTVAAGVLLAPDLRGHTGDGTILLEDIENLRPSGQELVTGFLERRNALGTPLRIIASSRYSVAQLLESKAISQELICALDVGRLIVPPLRQRRGDILPLARGFLRRYAEWQKRPALHFTATAEQKLLSHDYPANVRELRNAVERAVALAARDDIDDDTIVFPDQAVAPETRHRVPRSGARPKANSPLRLPTMLEMEREYLVMLIRELKGRRTSMSRVMGVSYPTVLKKIARHGLNVRAIVQEAERSHSQRPV